MKREEPLRDLFFRFLRLHLQGEELPRPELPEGGTRTLPELELYCRKLDLYFSFAKAFGCPVDEGGPLRPPGGGGRGDQRDPPPPAEKQHPLLCRVRGGAPLHHHGRLCEACYRKQRRR